MSSLQPTPDELLHRFGLENFRVGQRIAVRAALDGRDSLVVMPTGGGKSLCYQLPALADRGLVLVISPLIALMSDQLDRLTAAGVRAAMLASGMGETHNHDVLAQIASGHTQLVLATPERLSSHPFRRALAHRRIALFVVDEAHCIVEWGHGFRPDYLRLRESIIALGRPPVMAATATASPSVANEIAARLSLRRPICVRSPFDRPNLTLDVIGLGTGAPRARKRAVLLHLLAGPGAVQSRPAIVYCGTRTETDQVSDLLRRHSVRTVAYHAGMSAPERHAAQQAFMNDDADVIVATSAFGMGVDKQNVRTVIHWSLPTSLESYYQEAGRAGRDGLPARALLLAARVDLGRLIHFNTLRESNRSASRRAWSSYRAIDAFISTPVCRRRQILEFFGDPHPAAPTGRCCDLCHPDPVLRDVLAQATSWLHMQAGGYGTASTNHTLRWAPPAVVTQTGNHPANTPNHPAHTIDDNQLRTLITWRRQCAGDKPAFCVMSNAVLEGVLRARPRSTSELLEIRGIGPSFCERYGDSLLQTLSRL